MVEKNLLVDGIKFEYEGLFDLQKLLYKIDELTIKKGYARVEKERSQKVGQNGKDFFIELRPTKKPHPYHMLMIKIKIYAEDVKIVDVKIDGVSDKLERGKVKIIFDGWEYTDFMFRWEQKPWYHVARNVFDKFVYKFIGKYSGTVVEDTHYLYDNIKAYLELHRYAIEDNKE